MDNSSNMPPNPLGIVIAGLSGGSGKSVVSVGVTAAFRQKGREICSFKKGPDYIDAGWLQLAAETSCYNLDPYLMSPDAIMRSFFKHSAEVELVTIEGNRGLFDGVDVSGSFSTAELAIMLNLPVLLVIDCTKTTRTVAALVLGCQQLAPDLNIVGCVLNRIGSNRHETIIRQSIEKYTDVKVVGAVRRQKRDIFPQRHIGITPCPEFAGAAEAVKDLGELVKECVDLDLIEEMMAEINIPEQEESVTHNTTVVKGLSDSSLRIGVIKDAAFQFYYQENIAEITKSGAQLIEINALQETVLPELDGLYIGGGFPETSVRQLSANSRFREALKAAIEKGLPVYAECGGLIYLGKGMEVDGEYFPLAGVFPVSFKMMDKPQAHGYTILETSKNNPFYQKDTVIKGHEFRYSKIVDWCGDSGDLAFIMSRGKGFADGRDGLVYKNTLALYTHIHALGTPEWAEGFIRRARCWTED